MAGPLTIHPLVIRKGETTSGWEDLSQYRICGFLPSRVPDGGTLMPVTRLYSEMPDQLGGGPVDANPIVCDDQLVEYDVPTLQSVTGYTVAPYEITDVPWLAFVATDRKVPVRQTEDTTIYLVVEIRR